MTRKKFVKQLMAMGHDRDHANAVAYLYRVSGVSYAQALEEYRPEATMIMAMKNFQRAVRELAESIAIGCAAVCKQLQAEFGGAFDTLTEAFAALPAGYLRDSTEDTMRQLEEVLTNE